MSQQLTIPSETLKKFSQLADLLEQASRVARNLTKQTDDEFWAECEELQTALSDLNEHEIEALVDNAVQAVRAEQTILQK